MLVLHVGVLYFMLAAHPLAAAVVFTTEWIVTGEVCQIFAAFVITNSIFTKFVRPTRWYLLNVWLNHW